MTVDDVYQTTYYSRGFLVGGKDEKDQYVLNNHVRIYLDYHQVCVCGIVGVLCCVLLRGGGSR